MPGGSHASACPTGQTASRPASLGSILLRMADLSDSGMDWQETTLAKMDLAGVPCPPVNGCIVGH